MQLDRIEVRLLRNLTSVSLLPSPGLNLIVGNNASGKTTLLEAIHLLGLARSFRSGANETLIQRGRTELTLFTVASDGRNSHRIGLQRSDSKQSLIRVDGSNLHSRSALASLLPLSLITPESVLLLTGTPSERRNYLDWVMFHVEPSFVNDFKSFNKNLRQRNALLRSGYTQTLEIWSEGVIDYGLKLDYYRQRSIELLKDHLEYFIARLLPDLEITYSYRRGWNKEQTLEEALESSIKSDIKLHYTSSGPQRADFVLRHNQRKVVDVLSRGQLKLLLCAMKLAQISLIKDLRQTTPVVLVDDLPAELDKDHRQLLLTLLQELQAQVFVTATSQELLDSSDWSEVKVFHVEHGEIKEVV